MIIFRIHGGSVPRDAITEKMHQLPPIVIIRLRNMNAIDATGLFALEEIAKQLHRDQAHADLAAEPA